MLFQEAVNSLHANQFAISQTYQAALAATIRTDDAGEVIQTPELSGRDRLEVEQIYPPQPGLHALLSLMGRPDTAPRIHQGSVLSYINQKTLWLSMQSRPSLSFGHRLARNPQPSRPANQQSPHTQ
jgi:hypothetical protein